MKTTITTINPKLAAEMLQTSKAAGGLNRDTKAKLNRLIQQFRAGRWILNGEPIIIGASGRILDGHHRLTACCMANVSFDTVLVTEATEAALDTIDTGSSRSISDTLHLAGHAGKKSMLSALGKAVGLVLNTETHGNPFHPQPPAYEITDWLKAHPNEELECMEWTQRASSELPCAPKPLLAYLFLIGSITAPRDVSEEFFNRVATGLGLIEGDPAGALRQFFTLEVPTKNKGGRRALGNVDLLARMIKALDAAIHHESISKLTWSSKKEQFPTIRPLVPAGVIGMDNNVGTNEAA